MTQEVVSFVLRFVREESGGQPARWRGVIKHVQSDHTADFARFGDALQFMQNHVDDAIRQAFAGPDPVAPETLFAETARLWGEMAPRYTDIMLQSMEVMLEQGRRVGESFAESMANWSQTAQQTTQDQQGQLLDVIERLAAQVETLTAKVDDLEARLRDE
jgi:polyhydroxyalkanoate synthesis regulator phasin